MGEEGERNQQGICSCLITEFFFTIAPFCSCLRTKDSANRTCKTFSRNWNIARSWLLIRQRPDAEKSGQSSNAFLICMKSGTQGSVRYEQRRVRPWITHIALQVRAYALILAFFLDTFSHEAGRLAMFFPSALNIFSIEALFDDRAMMTGPGSAANDWN